MSLEDMNRRNFLKLGLLGSTALGAVGLTASISRCKFDEPLEEGWKMLRTKDRAFLRIIAPYMLQGALPPNVEAHSQSIEQMLQHIDSAIFALGPHNQQQMMDLFNLLHMSITRGITTGVWRKWQHAGQVEITQFLARWRNSSIGLFNAAYNGLNKLIVTTWYGQPLAWDKSNYPGPPFKDLLITQQKR